MKIGMGYMEQRKMAERVFNLVSDLTMEQARTHYRSWVSGNLGCCKFEIIAMPDVEGWGPDSDHQDNANKYRELMTALDIRTYGRPYFTSPIHAFSKGTLVMWVYITEYPDD